MWTVCNLYCHSEPSCKAIPMFTAWDNPKLAYTGILYISLLCQLSWLWTILLSGTAQSRGWQRTWSSLICTSRASKVENKSCLFGGVELVPETGRELVAFSDLTIQGLYCMYVCMYTYGCIYIYIYMYVYIYIYVYCGIVMVLMIQGLLGILAFLYASLSFDMTRDNM